MPSNGYIQVHAYSSYAQLPLENVAIAVTSTDGTAIAMRLTDRSGQIAPISIPTPPIAESQTSGSPEIPFAVVDIHARLAGYEQIFAKNVQVFADTVTLQNLEMIPISEMPEKWDGIESFDTPAQNL